MGPRSSTSSSRTPRSSHSYLCLRRPRRIWMKPNVLGSAVVAVLRCCTDFWSVGRPIWMSRIRAAHSIGRCLRDRLGMSIVPVSLRGEDARASEAIAGSLMSRLTPGGGRLCEESAGRRGRRPGHCPRRIGGIEAVWLQLGGACQSHGSSMREAGSRERKRWLLCAYNHRTRRGGGM
jgi:hypothetical protein